MSATNDPQTEPKNSRSGPDPLEQLLSTVLYRVDCPTLDILRDYHWGLLTPEESSATQRHLEQCPSCTDELRQLANFILSGCLQRWS